MPMRSQRSDLTFASKADSTLPTQQLGSNTWVSMSEARSAPARRQTPSGGARNVYSPHCGSYGPTSRYLSGPGFGGAADAHSMTPPSPDLSLRFVTPDPTQRQVYVTSTVFESSVQGVSDSLI